MTHAAACPACPPPPAERTPARATVPQADALLLSVPGLHCAGCIGTVERALTGMPGVRGARVNLSLKRVSVQADPSVGPEHVAETLRRAGYAAYPLDTTVLAQAQDRTARDLLMRMAVAGFAMMNVMLLSVAVWSGAADATRALFHLISAAIAVPVVGFSGQPFFRSALSALRARSLNMDVPISLAILLATGMSLYETMNGGRHAWFDAALSLTFFLLIGRFLDQRTRGAARSAARELAALEVHTAHLLRDGQTTRVPVAALAVGDRVLVPTGVRVPVDGTLSGPATTDRSFLTGESAAVSLPTGAPVQAGEVNLGAPFTLTATAVGEQTTLRRISALVETAEAGRNRYTALADRAARVYAPAVHLLALLAFAGWVLATGDPRLSLNIAIAVLIITCPCALGLAVPAVATAAIGRLYRQGFLVKSGTALERLAEVDTVIFDKTGTLTVPGTTPDLAALTPEQRAVARALAQGSDHPVSRAVVAGLPDQAAADVTDLTEMPGCGIEGRLHGERVRLGRGAWLGAGFDGPGLRIGAAPAIPLPMQETLRPGAAEAIAALKQAGYALRIVSGDRADAVERVATRLGLDALSGQTAEQKHALLRDLADRGHRVCMVGDGLNDAAALAAAHASVAPSSALDASRNAADIVVLRDSFADLPQVLATARKATRLSRQNFAIATGYNAVAVPVALMGHATPLLAALAMSVSSITVLLNALRVSARR